MDLIAGVTTGRRRKADFGRYHWVETTQRRPTAEACTGWDHLPLVFPIPTEANASEDWPAYPFTQALCGATLPRRLDATWIAGATVTCPRCLRLRPATTGQLSLGFAHHAVDEPSA